MPEVRVQMAVDHSSGCRGKALRGRAQSALDGPGLGFGVIAVLEPIAPPEGEERRLAPRPSSLAGKVLAVFDGNGPNTRDLLDDLGALLTERRGVRGVRYRNAAMREAYDLFDGKRAAVLFESPEETARNCDLALVGVGY